MSNPILSPYPGYSPTPPKKPFWSRTKVGIAAGVAGLLVGIAGSASEGQPSDDPRVAAAKASLADVVEQKTDLEQELEDERTAAEEAVAEATLAAEAEAEEAQREAVAAAVAKVRAKERRKTAAAVKSARTEGLTEGRAQGAAASAAEAAAETPAVTPLASTGGATDPQFSYCYEANDAGYGPYYQGQDPEYAWYDDRDGDGVVCET